MSDPLLIRSMGRLPAALARAALVAACAAAAPEPAPAAFLHEFPRAPVIVELHPRGDRPFTLDQLERALRQGVHAVELDLRERRADGTVVCAHRLRDVASAPTLDDALDAVFRRQGSAATVQNDGAQFFLFLDLKEETPGLHRGVVRSLEARAGRLSTAAHPPPFPRPVTVVITGFRRGLERAIPASALDTLCIVEGRSYGTRVRNLSAGDGRFQWIALEAPVDRSRVRDLHEGRDRRVRGRCNVRIVAAHGLLRRAVESGADAVNADPEQVEEAIRLAARGRRVGR